ncbi:hypothetical protein BGW38_007206 [Lunasporangiospora selenospora]|uniref:Uncharacterized protein n=1 Tax=Lunasporangiospora selenospora TaxID=979761 RepID=A0A9P6KAB1_9FUNG|nr:hypothetical protein BGW38_007206 [Lunasporangiospora selenospora]
MANPPLEYDWADVEDEIDFGAPVFSDDEDLPPELTTGVATLNTNDEPASSHCNTGRTSFTGDRVHDQSRSHEPTAGSRRIPPPDLDGWGLRNDRRRNDTPRSDRPQPSTQAGMNERRARNAPERRPPHDQDREAWRRGDRDTLHDRLHVPSGADRPRRQRQSWMPTFAWIVLTVVDPPRTGHGPPLLSRISPVGSATGHHPHHLPRVRPRHTWTMSRYGRAAQDTSPGGRWGKTPHEDKPYPSKPPPEIAGSPKDDTIYFRRRPTEPGKDTPTANSSSGSGTRHERHDALDSPRPPRDETSPRRQRRDASAPGEGTMHHERLETDGGKEHSMRDASASSGRWEKVKDPKPDLPYPENSLDTSSSRTPKVRGQVDSTGAGANPSEISSNKTPKARGQVNSTGAETNSSASRSNRGKGHEPSRNRGKGGRQALEADHDDNNDDTSAGSSVPWWEQATYSAKSKKEEPEPKAKPTTNASKNVSTTAKKGTTSPAQNEAKTGDDVPWWEQSTYKLAPRQQTTTATSSSDTLSKNIASKASTGASSTSTTTTRKDTRTESDKMARREALGKKAPTNSGIESMVLLSRGGDDSG